MTPFMLADRGECSFVQKVRNMENAGAAVGIVVDSSNESIGDIVMSDDGSGAGIRIPSMLISKKDGLKLINFMTNTASKKELEQISIIASFNMTHRKSGEDDIVYYDLWYSSMSEKALDFMMDFLRVDRAFGDRVVFTPRFIFWECHGCDKKTLKEDCLGNGQYCGNTNSKMTGR